MPYITPEHVKAIRIELAKLLPEYKLSITREHGSSVNISIMSGPCDFETTHASVNHFYIDRDYEGEAKRVLSLIAKTADKDNKDMYEDGDYGTAPTYYVNIEIGKWNKPYVQLVIN